MPRFVVLWHELPAHRPRSSHYDLMLESDGVLRTWATEQLPAPDTTMPAERLADHRLAYLEYEGPVSGDRGSVTRVAAGEYELQSESVEEIRVRLTGETIRGTLTIASTAGDPQRCRISLAGG